MKIKSERIKEYKVEIEDFVCVKKKKRKMRMAEEKVSRTVVVVNAGACTRCCVSLSCVSAYISVHGCVTERASVPPAL